MDMQERKIDIRAFTKFEYIDRFCERYGFDLVWKGNDLIITER